MHRSNWFALVVFGASVAYLLAFVPRLIDAGQYLPLIEARTDLQFLAQALERATSERGSPPTDSDGLAALVPSYLDKIASDPWGNAYVYRRANVGSGYEVYSRGRNGLDEHGRGDDVTLQDKPYQCADYEVTCGVTLGAAGAMAALASACCSAVLLSYRFLTTARRRRQ